MATRERTSSKGLGMSFSVPLREEVQNRHVRFAAMGMWANPSNHSPARRGWPSASAAMCPRSDGRQARAQLRRVAAPRAGLRQGCRRLGRYRLTAVTATDSPSKSATNEQSSWLACHRGQNALSVWRSSAMKPAASPCRFKKVLQKYPALARDPKAPRTRLRRDQSLVLVAPSPPPWNIPALPTPSPRTRDAYEDWKEWWGRSAGTANTHHELTLWALAGVPPNAPQVSAWKKTAAEPALLVATPGVLPTPTAAFGFWDLPGPFHPRPARPRRPVG